MHWGNKEDNYIASLDPLGVDDLIREVPVSNENNDVNNLIRILCTFCERASIEQRDYFETAAIIRDIGIVIGSIRKHDIEPVESAEKLGYILTKAGEQNDLPPRDTLMHYTIWNPTEERIRTYTLHPQEPCLIGSMRISIPQIRQAVRDLFELWHTDLNSPKALELASEIDRALKEFLKGLSHSKKKVQPEIFIRHFRPFFEPITLNNETLRGPGAVTMPMHIFDFILWGCSEGDARYQEFTKNYIPYNLSEFRNYYLRMVNGKSLLDKVEELVCSTKKREKLTPLLSAINDWFKKLEGFRHTKYAVDSYQGKEVHNFRTGSGGHTISDLELIAGLTFKHSQRVKNIMGNR